MYYIYNIRRYMLRNMKLKMNVFEQKISKQFKKTNTKNVS